MVFDILTLFPAQVTAMTNESILKRAQSARKVQINVHDLRNWTSDERKTVDDHPFGGGPGMLMMVEPIFKALKDLGAYNLPPAEKSKTRVVLTAAGGEIWTQKTAQEYADSVERLVIICGHYEGVDHRVSEHLVDAEISIGKFVLTGGELPAAVIVDSISRLLPGVVGNSQSIVEESHTHLDGKEYPQYTRPASFSPEPGTEWKVPEVLLSGNHAEIKKWQGRTSG